MYCSAQTNKGKGCARKATKDGFCWQHTRRVENVPEKKQDFGRIEYSSEEYCSLSSEEKDERKGSSQYFLCLEESRAIPSIDRKFSSNTFDKPVGTVLEKFKQSYDINNLIFTIGPAGCDIEEDFFCVKIELSYFSIRQKTRYFISFYTDGELGSRIVKPLERFEISSGQSFKIGMREFTFSITDPVAVDTAARKLFEEQQAQLLKQQLELV